MLLHRVFNMELSEEDVDVIRRASRNEKWWKYLRFVVLAFCLSAIFMSFWLIEHPDVLDSRLLRFVPGILGAFGGSYLGAVIVSWRNKERQLLLRLALAASKPGA